MEYSSQVAFDLLRDALSAIFGLSELKVDVQQLLEQAPPSPEYIPDPMELEDHVPVYIPEPEHPEDLVPAEDEASTPLLPPLFLSLRIRPLSPRGTRVGDERFAQTDILRLTHHLARTHYRGPGLRDTDEEDDDRHRDVEERSVFHTRHHDAQMDRFMQLVMRAEIGVLRREGLAYEQESIQTRQDLARSEAHCRALEAQVTVLETEALIDQGVAAAMLSRSKQGLEGLQLQWVQDQWPAQTDRECLLTMNA
ncbi:hypothetical protein Tco_0550443 [Tanacetum coccineum]